MKSAAPDRMPALSHFRGLFPVTGHCIYFNHAGTGPMSVPARKAIEECVETYSKQAEFHIDDYLALVQNARNTVARFLNAEPQEITFTHNTSEGIYIAMMNLQLEPGDMILVMNEVFPAVRYIVDHNFPHHQIKYVDFCGRDPVDVLKENLHPRPKVVVIDFVQFLSGEVIGLEPLSRFVQQQHIFLVVDGMQGIGALDYDAAKADVDFLSCGAAKWLFGPSGVGFLYVNKRNFSRLKTQHTGWLGADWQCFEDIGMNLPLFRDARKYEMGTRNIIGIQGLSANINILLEYGMESVNARIASLKARLRHFLETYGFDVLTPKTGVQSGIISARGEMDMQDLYLHLKKSSIVVSLRNGYLRFSPHFYNTEEEVDRVINAIKMY